MAFRVLRPRGHGALEALGSVKCCAESTAADRPCARRGGRKVRALAFVADAAHPQYVRELDLHGRAQLVAQGIGQRGRCTEYIRRTLDHMYELGVTDPHLER